MYFFIIFCNKKGIAIICLWSIFDQKTDWRSCYPQDKVENQCDSRSNDNSLLRKNGIWIALQHEIGYEHYYDLVKNLIK